MDFGNVDDFLPENDRNVIYDVPSHIVDLVGLVELSLANAFVSKLPENFGELKNLEKLDLHNNQISWLPPSFVLLAKLQVSLI
jgi:Leucine-rich repeat (LRR) protein